MLREEMNKVTDARIGGLVLCAMVGFHSLVGTAVTDFSEDGRT